MSDIEPDSIYPVFSKRRANDDVTGTLMPLPPGKEVYDGPRFPEFMTNEHRNFLYDWGFRNVEADQMSPDLQTPIAPQHLSALARILLIRHDRHTNVYRDVVLRSAGFVVKVITAKELPAIIDDGIATYSAVILGHGLTLEETSEITMQLRLYSPASKIVLMDGPELQEIDPSPYDAIIDSLSGAKAFVSTVRRMVAN